MGKTLTKKQVNEQYACTMPVDLKELKIKSVRRTGVFRPTLVYYDYASHVSNPLHQGHESEFRGHGSVSPILEWFDSLPKMVRDRFKLHSGLNKCRKALKRTYCDLSLLRGLSYYWWDTTHTFHFPIIGELTMTPTDYSAITGLRCSGERLPVDLSVREDRARLQALVGDKWHLFHQMKDVPYVQIMEEYRDYEANTPARVDQLLRVFCFVFIGTTFMSDTSSRTVDTYWLSCLEDIENMKKFKWGAAGLATLYLYMDGLSRGRGGSGGFQD